MSLRIPKLPMQRLVKELMQEIGDKTFEFKVLQCRLSTKLLKWRWSAMTAIPYSFHASKFEGAATTVTPPTMTIHSATIIPSTTVIRCILDKASLQQHVNVFWGSRHQDSGQKQLLSETNSSIFANNSESNSLRQA